MTALPGDGPLFRRRTVVILAICAAVSLGLMLLLPTLQDARSPGTTTAESNAFSASAIGHQALASVLEALAVDVEISRSQTLNKLHAGSALLLLEPATGGGEVADQERTADLIAAALNADRPVLVVLPKWIGFEAGPPHSGWIHRRKLQAPSDAAIVLGWCLRAVSDAGWGPGATDWAAVAADLKGAIIRPGAMGGEGDAEVERFVADWDLGRGPDLPAAQLIDLRRLSEAMQRMESHPGVVARAWSDRGILALSFEGTRLLVVSDPDLMNAAGIGLGDNALLTYRMVTEGLGARRVVIDETIHGFALSDSLWRELGRFPLVLLTLHLSLLLALVVWASMGRFGRPQPLPPRIAPGKETLIANTATMLGIGGHVAHSVGEYFRGTLRVLSRVYGLPAALDEPARLRRLAELAQRRGTTDSPLILAQGVAGLSQLSRGRRGGRLGVAGRRRGVQLARRIHRFRSEMMHGS